MIVLDASAVVELLINSRAGKRLWHRISSPQETLHAPQLLDVEVLHVLRRNSRLGALDAERGLQAVQDLADLPIVRYPHEPFRSRVWELRSNLSSYDGFYVALSEALDAPLLTLDARLGATRGHQARIDVVRPR
jgi:predicted nucleic acid-binding protein